MRGKAHGSLFGVSLLNAQMNWKINRVRRELMFFSLSLRIFRINT